MIEHKFFDLGGYKKLEDVERELDKLTNYEGWFVICAVGKKNNVLVLRRVLEEYAPEVPTTQVPETPTPKTQPKKKAEEKRFPDAVCQ